MAASGPDPAQLLHVNTEQLPGRLPLVAANHPPRGSVRKSSRQILASAPPWPPAARSCAVAARKGHRALLPALSLPPAQPPVHRLSRAPRRRGRHLLRPPFPLYPLDQHPPALLRQPRSRSSILPEDPSKFWMAVPETVVSGPSLCQQGPWEPHLSQNRCGAPARLHEGPSPAPG